MKTDLQAVIFDWAGTVIDHGSRAPMGVFVEVFKRFGVEISVAEARLPMGLAKWDHIQAIGRQPRVAAAWQQAKGRAFADSDADEIYKVFVPLNREIIGEFADLIPGVAETMAQLRQRGLAVGSTTGYTRDIMERLLPLAAEQGFAPDTMYCTGDTSMGRPAPLMLYRCLVDLGVWPAWQCVKVDDTVPGIQEGCNAACWTVGVTLTGNGVGLDAADLAALSNAERDTLRQKAATPLLEAGAHYLIDSVADLLPVLDTIEQRLQQGERPWHR